MRGRASLWASRLAGIMRGRWQNRGPVRGSLFLLHFQLGCENSGRGGRNRYGAGLRATVAVEYFRGIAGGHDFRERGQRRSDDIDAPDQFIRAAVGKHLVDHQREDLKGLRLSAPGEGETAGDVVNQQTERFSLLFDELDQLGAQLGVRDGLAAFHDQIALAGNRSRAELTASMAVGSGETHERRTRHLKILQDSVIHKRHALRRNALVIELVVAQQVIRPELLLRGVVHDAQETRQDGFADLFRKSLAFGGIFLPVAFGAVSKNFVEKDGSRAAGQERRSNRWLVNRCGNESFKFLAHGGLRGGDGFVVRRVSGIDPVKIVVALDVHSIRRLALDEQLQAVTDLAELQLGSFAGDLEDVLGLRGEGDNGIDNRRGFAERVSIGTDFFFPRFAVQRERDLRANVGVRLLVREVGCTIFDRIYFYFFARLDLDEGFRGGAVLAVGLEPHGAPENAGIIIEWNSFARAGACLRPLANLMCVIRFVGARAHGNFQPAVACLAAIEERAV